MGTIHGLRIVGLTIDWAIHGPTVIGRWKTVIGVPVLTIDIGVRRQAIGGPILTTNLMGMCTTVVVIVTTSTMAIIPLYNVQSAPEGSTFTKVVHTQLNFF